MARNAEKAMTTLARWRAAQTQEHERSKARRPFLASECKSLRACEKWRTQIIREIARKVSQIQNAGLGEFRIRDLNDEINKLLREKGHWEAQIKELGGPDYSVTGPKMLDAEGKEVPGNRGYKYFGAARMLPGVRELFEQAPPPHPKKTRSDLMKYVDADYYGYRDDDDGVIIPLEAEEEKKAVELAVAEWKVKKEKKITENEENADDDEDNPLVLEPLRKEEERLIHESLIPGASFISHVPVPSQKDIEAAILEKRKQELLNRYAYQMDYEESSEQ